MNFSKLETATGILTKDGILVPSSEKEIRQKAFEILISKPHNLVPAYEVLFGRTVDKFTREDWNQVLGISGRPAVMGSMVAYTGCLNHGLITV